MKLPRLPAGLTTWSLLALLLGCALGGVGHATGSPAVAALARAVAPLGELWVWSLKLLVLPLVVLQVMAAVVASRDRGPIGGVGLRAILLFLAMLVTVGVYTIAVVAAITRRIPTDSSTLAVLAGATTTDGEAAAVVRPSFLGWLTGLLTANPVTSALEGNVLPLLLASILVALLVSRLPLRTRASLTGGIRTGAAGMIELTRRLLWLLPVGVFVLVFPIVLEAGSGVTGFLGLYVVIQCALVLTAILLLYPATALLGRVPVRTFARGVSPAQLVAASTRSSLASLPALVQGARDRLGLPASATGVVLPLAVALFKLSGTASAPLRLFVLAKVYDIPLSVGTAAIFLVTIILLSFGTVGLPSGLLAIPTLPAYMAAGIPIEGVVILEAVDAIPDVFKTVLNVTADMSAATILSRAERREAEGARADLPRIEDAA
jgi:Na+/H+-dicarboxylate symporter